MTPIGSRRAPGDQIWSQLLPIGLTGLESWLPDTLTWYLASSGPPGPSKGPVLAPKGAQIGSKLKIVGNLSCDLSKFAREGHLAKSGPSGPFKSLWGPQKGLLGPKQALLGALGAQKRPDTRSKCLVTMIPAQSDQLAPVGTKSGLSGPSKSLWGPQKGL